MAKRRANGEGNIRKRKDGRWEGRYTAGHDPETGKQIIKNVLGKTQAEVREKLKAAIADSQGMDFSKADEFTLAGWLQYWLEHYGRFSLRPASLESYSGYLRNHIQPKIGGIKLNKLVTADLQKFYNFLYTKGRVQRKESVKQPQGLNAKTIRNLHNFLSHALDKAVDERLLSRNPAQGCTLPATERREMKTLPLEQLDKFFVEAKASGVFELYYTALATGLRRGELLALKWTDIDFQERSIYIQRQVTRVGGVVREAPLKTKNAYRKIILSQELAQLLKAKRELENGFSVYVFPSPTGTVISPDSVLHMLHRVLERAGLEQVRFHDLRHTFATLALKNGVDVKTLSGLLGHFSAAFTLDTYGHISTGMKEDAAAKIGGFLESTMN